VGLGLALAVVLAASQGCTNWQGGVPGFLKNRLKDAMECVDYGVTVTKDPQFSFYLAVVSMTPIGCGKVDGTFYGMGGGDIGAMRIHYEHWGVMAYGREVTGWGNSVWSFPEFDPKKPETMNCQGVGIGGFFTPPFDARPGGRPT
jgi:hypothetical protein